jgi:hypothetical protein
MAMDLQSDLPSGTLVWTHLLELDIVFGLDWTPLVGGVPAKLARSRARALGATYYLVAGSLAAVVGCGIIHKSAMTGSEQLDRSKPLHSAAAIFALTHQEGVVAFISFMPGKGFWLVAANSGLVLAKTDCWFASSEDVEDALSVLTTRFPNIQILRSAELSKDHLPEWLSRDISLHSRLQKVSCAKHLSLRVACLAVLIGAAFWAMGTRTSESTTQLPELDRDALWQNVYDAFALMHPVHQPEQLLSVIHAWNQAPLKPGGWKLKQIVCEPFRMDWHCAARYQRVKRLALSEHLDAAKPVGWVSEFTDLEHGVLRWQVASAASAFKPVAATTPLKNWLSYLQSVAPLFDSIQIGAGSLISMTAPLGREGMPLARPPQLKPLTRRHIAIKGPLRSLSALKGLPVPVRWRGLHLEIEAPVGQGISRSALTVSLTGEIFETTE